ncbi:hypothetical protein [Bacillus sp. Marseille-Q3570]|uniref:hypothetical protein n=1 Tax=Bacillus sp. Marseille-Q3570 TaxID=2963522 RepID=UPI0021B6F84E|nr:hypothetical protein [Bacillus sp. Marseille-Q3570]
MRRMFILGLLLVLSISSAFITPIQQIDQLTLEPDEEKVISTYGYLVSAESVTLSSPTTNPKGSSKSLSNLQSLFVEEPLECVPYDFTSGSHRISDAISFIYAVMYHSNYLS